MSEQDEISLLGGVPNSYCMLNRGFLLVVVALGGEIRCAQKRREEYIQEKIERRRNQEKNLVQAPYPGNFESGSNWKKVQRVTLNP